MRAMLSTLHQPHRRPLWRAVFLILLVFVSWMAFAPTPPPDGVQHLDKARHLAAFAVLAAVAAMAWRAPARIAAGLLAYGVLIELVQTRIPGRHGSAADVLADLIGIALGLFIVQVFKKVA